MQPLDFVGSLGYVGIAAALFLLAQLSRRLGSVTRVRPYYLGIYCAAIVVCASAVVRIIFTIQDVDIEDMYRNLRFVLLTDGLIALGVTVALILGWYYWSWLLAERD